MKKFNPSEEQINFLQNKEKQIGDEHLKNVKALYDNGLNKIWKIIEFTGKNLDHGFLEVNYGTYLLHTPLAGLKCNYYLLRIQKLIEEDSKVTDLASFGLAIFGLDHRIKIPNPNFWNVDLAKVVEADVYVQFAIKNDSNIGGLIEYTLKHLTNGTINATSCTSSWGVFLNIYLSDKKLYCSPHLEHIKKLGINKWY
jgi:hypothetical protein